MFLSQILLRFPDHFLQDALLLSLEVLHASFSMLDSDDASLRATVALRLAILQADFQGDYRKACQVTVIHFHELCFASSGGSNTLFCVNRLQYYEFYSMRAHTPWAYCFCGRT